MLRNALVCVVIAPVVAALAFAATAAGQARQHSGVIVAVTPDAQTITVEEMGPGSTMHRRIVRLTSQTKIELAARAERTPATGGWPGGFVASPLQAIDLHPGDFATVTAPGLGDELVAASIVLVRTAGPRRAEASPRSRSR